MVVANSMPGMGMGMGGMNMMANPYMGMMAMHGMPAASSTQGLMQWMKQQQDLASQQCGGLNNLQIFCPGAGGSSSSTPAQQPCSGNNMVDNGQGAAAGQTQSQAMVQQQCSPEKNEIETKADPFTFKLDTDQALEEATKVSDALDDRKTGLGG